MAKLKHLLKKSLNSLSSEDSIFFILAVMLNTTQLSVVLYIGLYFDCITQVIVVSCLFWVLRGDTKHFSPLLCTIITFGFYIIVGIIIKNTIVISFMPIILGLLLVTLTKRK